MKAFCKPTKEREREKKLLSSEVLLANVGLYHITCVPFTQVILIFTDSKIKRIIYKGQKKFPIANSTA